MALIINAELFSKNITNEEFLELYRMVDGWLMVGASSDACVLLLLACNDRLPR